VTDGSLAPQQSSPACDYWTACEAVENMIRIGFENHGFVDVFPFDKRGTTNMKALPQYRDGQTFPHTPGAHCLWNRSCLALEIAKITGFGYARFIGEMRKLGTQARSVCCGSNGSWFSSLATYGLRSSSAS